MIQQMISFRAPRELARAFKRFADENFGGSTSDAGRFIFSTFLYRLRGERSPEVAAVMAAYNNAAPKLISRLAQASHKTEDELRKKIQEAVDKLETEVKR